MPREHADFDLGTGPDAHWLGSLAEVSGPDQLSRLDARAVHSETTGVLSTLDPDTYEAAIAVLLDHQHATEGGFLAVPDPGDQVSWPWLASTSARWYAYAFTNRRVRVVAQRPVVHPPTSTSPTSVSRPEPAGR